MEFDTEDQVLFLLMLWFLLLMLVLSHCLLLLITLMSINVNMMLLKAKVDFLWWVGWGLQSHFRVQPNFCVDVVLSLGL